MPPISQVASVDWKPNEKQKELIDKLDNIQARKELCGTLMPDEWEGSGEKYLEDKERFETRFLQNRLDGFKECVGVIEAYWNFVPCSTGRFTYPNVRGKAEDMIIKDIEEKYPNKSKKLVYVGFASGKLYQDFIILNLLWKKGYKNIQIIVIDII